MKLRQQRAHMKAAGVYADLSYCKRRHVGCVIVQNDNIISIGYNGTPPGADNTCEGEDGLTKPSVIHAEQNAINKLKKDDRYRSSDLSDAVLFVTTAPCVPCATSIVELGIKRVLFRDAYLHDDGIKHLADNGVEVSQLQE